MVTVPRSRSGAEFRVSRSSALTSSPEHAPVRSVVRPRGNVRAFPHAAVKLWSGSREVGFMVAVVDATLMPARRRA